VEWQTPLTYATDPGERQGFGMAIAGGRLVVGDLDVFGIDRKTGAIMWRFSPNIAPREQAGRGRLTSDGTTVFAGSVSGRLYAIDGATGTERWRARVADSTLSVNNPILADGVLYVSLLGVYPSRAGGAAAVDAHDGKLLWFTPTPPDPLKLTGASATVGVTPTLVIVGAEDDKIYGFDRQTGEIRLTLSGAVFRLPETGPIYSSVEFIITTFGSTVYVGSLGSMIAALDGSDLHVLWTARVAADVWDTRATSDRFYIAGVGGGLVVLRTLDGKVAWTAPGAAFPYGLAHEQFLAAPSIDTDRVYIGGESAIYSFKKQ
jgi:outer membrane protein assembly factor BamB